MTPNAKKHSDFRQLSVVAVVAFFLVALASTTGLLLPRLSVLELSLVALSAVAIPIAMLKPSLLQNDLVQSPGLFIVYLLVIFRSFGGHFDIEYFKAMAHLIPVLFLAFVVEQRAVFRGTAPNTTWRLTVLVIGIALIFAGTLSFTALAGDKADDLYGPPINGEVVSTTLYLVLSLIAPYTAPPSDVRKQGSSGS
jgi:hypothetical protein